MENGMKKSAINAALMENIEYLIVKMGVLNYQSFDHQNRSP